MLYPAMEVTSGLLRLVVPIAILLFSMKEVESITSLTQPLPDLKQGQESSQILVRQHYGAAMPQTTPLPLSVTTMSLEPQTSISVHTVVRNKPVYMPPQTVSPLTYSNPLPKEADDSSYSYTYEDVSEAESTKSLTEASTKPPRSFWNNQKSSLDSRRLNAAKKYPSGYHRQIGGDTRTTSKAPRVEFKKRERPKFGATKKPFVITYKTKATESTTVGSTTTSHATTTKSFGKEKSYQTANNEAKYSDYKVESNVKPQSSNLKTNNIVGRVGELPLQQSSSSQSQFRQGQLAPAAGSHPTNYEGSGQSSVAQQNYLQLPTQNDQQNSPLSGNVFIRATAPQSSVNHQQLQNSPVGSASNPAPGQQSALSLLSRLGALRAVNGLNRGEGYPAPKNGKGGGFSVNLGAVPDPITFILKLLSLIPRPLLNLNSRLFFGIELGSNAGLVSGVPKAG